MTGFHNVPTLSNKFNCSHVPSPHGGWPQHSCTVVVVVPKQCWCFAWFLPRVSRLRLEMYGNVKFCYFCFCCKQFHPTSTKETFSLVSLVKKTHIKANKHTPMTQWPNLDHFHQVDLGKTRIEMAKYTQPSHRETLFTHSLSTKSWRHSDDSMKTTILLPPKRRQTHSQSTAHARKLIQYAVTHHKNANQTVTVTDTLEHHAKAHPKCISQ